MCNACGFSCCAFDDFEGCGCNCDEWRCRVSRCGGCGQSIDATDPGADCVCFPDDDYWEDEDDHLVTALGNGARKRQPNPSENGGTPGSDRAITEPSPDGHNPRESGRSEP